MACAATRLLAVCSLAAGVEALHPHLHGTLRVNPVLRVRGGITRSTTAATAAAAELTSELRPLLLDEAEAGVGATTVGSATPDLLKVFRKVLGYVWPPSWRERGLLIASISFLVLSKSCNVYVPFMLKRAVDTLEAASLASGTAAAVTAAATPLLVGYVLVRLGVALANEARSLAYVRLSQSAVRAFSLDLFGKMHALDATFHNENPTGALSVAFGRGEGVLAAEARSRIATIFRASISCSTAACCWRRLELCRPVHQACAASSRCSSSSSSPSFPSFSSSSSPRCAWNSV